MSVRNTIVILTHLSEGRRDLNLTQCDRCLQTADMQSAVFMAHLLVTNQ